MMKQSIADMRKEYSAMSLDQGMVDKNPINQFLTWFQMASEVEIKEPNAMSRATISENGVACRIVLLKGVEAGKFLFYTNYESEKGTHISRHPQVALTFFWPELERQVRIEGQAKKVDGATSDAYFSSRPRGSQIGAWVSPQSAEIENREVLSRRLLEVEEKFKGKSVERPAHWGGYAVTPASIEFWQGRPSRLHDRIRYDREGNSDTWSIKRLAP